MMESVPEIAGSIMVFEMVEPDVGSVGNGYRNEGFDKRMLGVSETGQRQDQLAIRIEGQDRPSVLLMPIP